MENYPFRDKKTSEPIESTPINRPPYIFKCRNRMLHLGTRTHIMGILNVTPDSFYDGGNYLTLDKSLKQVEIMIDEGADMIDIGGESTRPGSLGVLEEEELRRVIPIIKEVSKRFDIILSIDTTKAKVADEALAEGASIINDISGLKFEPAIGNIAAKWKAGLIVMHTPSRPKDMQGKAIYNSVVDDVIESLRNSVELAENSGVGKESIIIDPGFGFGKTVVHNLELLKRLSDFLVLGKPVLIGTSMKSFIGKVLDSESAEDRREGTAATLAIGIMNGASIVRVHDVAKAKHIAMMADAIYNA